MQVAGGLAQQLGEALRVGRAVCSDVQADAQRPQARRSNSAAAAGLSSARPSES